MRQRRYIFDRLDRQAGGLERGDRAFAAAAGALHPNLEFLDAEFRGLLGALLSRALAGERRTLAAALEAARAAAGPAERISLGVGDRHSRVVEARLDVGDSHGDVASGFASLALGHR